MVIIPITLLIAARIPLRKKLVISLVLCSGGFCIAATMLRCIFTIENIGSVQDTIIWEWREIVVMVIAVCTPVIKVFLFSSRRASKRISRVYEIEVPGGSSRDESRHSMPRSERVSSPEAAVLREIHIPPASPFSWTIGHSNASNDTGEIFVFHNDRSQTPSDLENKIAVQYEVKVTSTG